MKCGKCEYKTETEIPDTSSVTEKQAQLRFHVEFNHPPPAQNVVGLQAEVYGQEDGCQLGQFICLGQIPDWGSRQSWCELCLDHFRGCWDGYVPCQGEMCKYNTDTTPIMTLTPVTTTMPRMNVKLDKPLEAWEMCDCGKCETERQQQLESHQEDEVQLVEVSGDIPPHLQGGADTGGRTR